MSRTDRQVKRQPAERPFPYVANVVNVAIPTECEYWEVRSFNAPDIPARLIVRGTYDYAVMVLTQLATEGIKAELVKVFPS